MANDGGPFLEKFEQPKAAAVAPAADLVETAVEVEAAAEPEPVTTEEIVVDAGNQDETEEEPVEPSLKMSKAELVAVAEERGVEVVPDTMTKADILAAIEG